jgi:hypothetical protein
VTSFIFQRQRKKNETKKIAMVDGARRVAGDWGGVVVVGSSIGFPIILANDRVESMLVGWSISIVTNPEVIESMNEL